MDNIHSGLRQEDCGIVFERTILNRQALRALPSLTTRLLPEGERRGHFYVGRRPLQRDARDGTISVDLDTGTWRDAAAGEAGYDIISLVMHVQGTSLSQAMGRLRRMLSALGRPQVPAATVVPRSVGCAPFAITAAEIVDEFAAHAHPLRQAESDHLTALSPLSSRTLHRRIVAANIVPDGAGCFDFARPCAVDAVRAFMVLARDEGGRVFDIAGFSPDLSRVIGTWLGAACAIGLDAIYGPRMREDGALSVWTAPAEWISSGFDGVVLLDPQRAHPHLRDVDRVIVANIEQGEALAALFLRGPAILIAPAKGACA